MADMRDLRFGTCRNEYLRDGRAVVAPWCLAGPSSDLDDGTTHEHAWIAGVSASAATASAEEASTLRVPGRARRRRPASEGRNRLRVGGLAPSGECSAVPGGVLGRAVQCVVLCWGHGLWGAGGRCVSGLQSQLGQGTFILDQ
ncbi:hypothetical protein IscW_ISCW015039 [Ixodes scapularis]|uniref:Uncharacterized protein n=1 Tax=Ixodes scapularis TaxID=6945 RepID=B7QM46_IXOSC|nr:hypothetical protein IscW_ISCW015039 [Ixodes scapularis]|eukprot:XP_002416251.1 hypothetical protein IscW_ISCW015039 [Ixodes scapularis]